MSTKILRVPPVTRVITQQPGRAAEVWKGLSPAQRTAVIQGGATVLAEAIGLVRDVTAYLQQLEHTKAVIADAEPKRLDGLARLRDAEARLLAAQTKSAGSAETFAVLRGEVVRLQGVLQDHLAVHGLDEMYLKLQDRLVTLLVATTRETA